MKIFGLILTIALYKFFELGKKIPILKKVPPILITAVAIIFILKTLSVSYVTYNQSASLITFLLAPATLALAYPLYKNLDVLKRHKRAIYFGLLFATIIATTSTYFLGKLFHADFSIIMSMIPKSVTTPIAVAISENIQGIPELTACLVILTGLIGGLLGHRVLKFLKIKNDVAIGLSIGASSHILGTTRCIEKGNDKQVAISTLALIITGVFTAIIAQVIFYFVK